MNYQQAMEQAANQRILFSLADNPSSVFPGVEFYGLRPNPQMERYDALLAESCNQAPLIPPFEVEDNERIDALTFFEKEELEAAFEYDYSRDPSNKGIIVRGHCGRIYGPGCYDDSRKEAKYQAFIRDTPRVQAAIEALKQVERGSRLCCFEALQSDALQVDVAQYWDVSYPYDLQDEIIEDPRKSPSYTAVSEDLFEEPFTRAAVISQEAEEFMWSEFYEPYWDAHVESDKESDVDSYGDYEHYDDEELFGW